MVVCKAQAGTITNSASTIQHNFIVIDRLEQN